MIKEHKITFSRSIVVSIFITGISFIAGIVFVDWFNIKFTYVWIFVIPLTFFIRYILNKYWVFKVEEKINLDNLNKINWNKEISYCT